MDLQEMPHSLHAMATDSLRDILDGVAEEVEFLQVWELQHSRGDCVDLISRQIQLFQVEKVFKAMGNLVECISREVDCVESQRPLCVWQSVG